MAKFTDDYAFEIVKLNGKKRYYISFSDGEKQHQRENVSKSFFRAMLELRRKSRNLTRWDERHQEQSELSDESLHKRAIQLPPTTEDTVLHKEFDATYHMAVSQLPIIQRRRYLLYVENGMTLQGIADIEHCSPRAVKYSIDLAKKRVSEKIV